MVSKNKKKRSNKVLIFFVMLLTFLLLGYFYVYLPNKAETIKILDKIEGYDYVLNENHSKLYETYYNELSSLLKKDIDYEDYAKTISSLFIIDFYTINNKVSKNDIGGVEFIHPDARDNFIDKARSTVYKYVQLKDSRTEKLPEVSSVDDISIETTTFTYNNTKYNAYKVELSFDYVEDLDYETNASLILIEEKGKLYIVKMN